MNEEKDTAETSTFASKRDELELEQMRANIRNTDAYTRKVEAETAKIIRETPSP